MDLTAQSSANVKMEEHVTILMVRAFVLLVGKNQIAILLVTMGHLAYNAERFAHVLTTLLATISTVCVHANQDGQGICVKVDVPRDVTATLACLYVIVQVVDLATTLMVHVVAFQVGLV